MFEVDKKNPLIVFIEKKPFDYYQEHCSEYDKIIVYILINFLNLESKNFFSWNWLNYFTS